MLKEGQDQSPRPRDDEGHNQLWKTRLISSDSIFFSFSNTHLHLQRVTVNQMVKMI